jgi:Zn-dependent metalloprotease
MQPVAADSGERTEMTDISTANAKSRGCGCCFVVPPHVLHALGHGKHRARPRDPRLFVDSHAATVQLGMDRGSGMGGQGLDAPPPRTHVPDDILLGSPARIFDCANDTVLPGKPLDTAAQAGAGGEAIAAATENVEKFYATVLGRNSIDRHGKPLISVLNYGTGFQNAFWSGQMMVYGNGDQHMFVDFWHAPDVICHEITHGITEEESGLVYHDEPGAVNESISDCFAAVFNQWMRRLPAADPSGWLLGTDLLGPDARAHDFACMRDLARPNAPHCLTPQQNIVENMDPGGDVHINSGIPNHAFSIFARALGGNAYDDPIKVWYAACTAQALSATATIADFAEATLRVAATWSDAARSVTLTASLQNAWKAVHVLK